jgi:glycosyltransferase involved in cell wall biosynthesis
MLDVSVVMFAFNEEENVEPVLEEAATFLAGATLNWELILVDDGSSDRTAERAREVAARYEGHLRVVSYRSNRGIGHALRTGFAEATREWVTLMPADGQIPPTGLLRLFDVVDGRSDLDLVTCHYPERFREADSLLRMILSRGLRLITWLATGIDRPLDGIYLIRRRVLSELPLRSETFFLNLELPLRALHQGVPAGATTMHIRPRRAGESKVVNMKRISGVLKDLATLGLELRTGVRWP